MERPQPRAPSDGVAAGRALPLPAGEPPSSSAVASSLSFLPPEPLSPSISSLSLSPFCRSSAMAAVVLLLPVRAGNEGIRTSPARLRRIRPPRRRPLPPRRRGRPPPPPLVALVEDDASASERAPRLGLLPVARCGPRPQPLPTCLAPPRGPRRARPAPAPEGPAPSSSRAKPRSSESVRSVRIRSTTLARLLHGFVLLPSGISVAGTGNAML